MHAILSLFLLILFEYRLSISAQIIYSQTNSIGCEANIFKISLIVSPGMLLAGITIVIYKRYTIGVSITRVVVISGWVVNCCLSMVLFRFIMSRGRRALIDGGLSFDAIWIIG